MMKVILIDDEPIIRQGLIHKIRLSGLPLHIAGEAGDGVAGLELLRRVQPDIVIADIQMPAMNGLDFIRQAKDQYPHTEFIIVSGYEDFRYAQQAIRYGVSNYLLKPVEDEELQEALSQLIDKLELERRRSQSLQELQLRDEAGRETLRQQALLRFIRQGEDAPADDRLQALKKHCVRFLAVSFLLEPFSMPHLSFAAGEENLLWYAVRNIVTERFAAGGIPGVLMQHSLHDHELVYVLGVEEARDTAGVSPALEEILYGIRKYLKLDLTIGVGSWTDKLEEIQESYREAGQSIRNAILHGKNRIFYSGGAAAGKLNRTSLIGAEDERLVFKWLEDRDTEMIRKWVERRVGAIVQDPDSVYIQLEWFCVDLYLLFQKYLLSQAELSGWAIGEMDDLLQWLQQLDDWREVMEQMKQFAGNIVGRMSQENPLAGKDSILDAKAYIDIHYREPLSLQSIAQRFYVHPNYFSRRFKEKVGKSFIDYLTSLRMKQAAVLLRDSEWKVHEIAGQVGFEDPTYFGIVFRKTYGKTPKEYRNSPEP